MNITLGDRVQFKSTDNSYHDLVSTDSNWYTTNNPVSVPVSSNLDITINFDRLGDYYFKDRINPLSMKMIIQVMSHTCPT